MFSSVPFLLALWRSFGASVTGNRHEEGVVRPAPQPLASCAGREQALTACPDYPTGVSAGLLGTNEAGDELPADTVAHSPEELALVCQVSWLASTPTPRPVITRSGDGDPEAGVLWLCSRWGRVCAGPFSLRLPSCMLCSELLSSAAQEKRGPGRRPESCVCPCRW